MPTPLYPTFRKRVDDAVELIITRQVTPWSFMPAGPPFRISMFDGRSIAYGGIAFEGSPREVFWSRYIEPFLEDLCVSEIDVAVSAAQTKGVDARLLLPELQELLCAGCERVYARMVDVDQRLRGKGRPETVDRRPISRERSAMAQFIEDRITAEIAMCKSSSRAELWYEKNKFWVWAIGIIVSVLGLLVGLLAKFG